MITVLLQPDGETVTVERAPTVLRLLAQIGRRATGVLVLRHLDNPDEKGRIYALLTPDPRLIPGETVTVRGVTSRG